MTKENMVEEVVTESKPMIGVVSNCKKLNVRRRPNKKADVLCVINQGTDVEIISDKPSSQFYKICLASGIAGYCIKEFIEIR